MCHVLVILEKKFSSTKEEKDCKEKVRLTVKKDIHNAIIQFVQNGDKHYERKIEKYKKKHPRALERKFA